LPFFDPKLRQAAAKIVNSLEIAGIFPRDRRIGGCNAARSIEKESQGV
jgi:hypothetical protein